MSEAMGENLPRKGKWLVASMTDRARRSKSQWENEGTGYKRDDVVG